MNHDKSDTQMCPETDMLDIVQAMQNSEARALQVLSDARRTWPDDPRIHLLLGAMHASQQRYEPARADFTEALRLTPDYPITSFMLGFLELVNGQGERAELAWTSLETLSPDDTLRIFRNGLSSLIHDRFDDALQQLRRGIASNGQYPLINRYIQAVIDKIGDTAETRDDATHDPAGQTVVSTPYDTPFRS